MPKLQRYIAKELTHFIGKKLKTRAAQYKILIEILNSCWLTHPPHNPNRSGNLRVSYKGLISENKMYSPEVICFCDIPVGDLNIHMKKYSLFGISFLKAFLIKKGANPVFYNSKNSTVFRHLNVKTRADLFDQNVKKLGNFLTFLRMNPLPQSPLNSHDLQEIEYLLNFHIFSFIKFFEASKKENDPNNYYMEREWRMLGNVKFTLNQVHRVILPKSFAKKFRKDVPNFYGQITFAD